MAREKDLVEAEIVDCMQDIAATYRDGAALELETACLLEKIAQTVGSPESVWEASMDDAKSLKSLAEKKALAIMRKSELIERYSRLLFEYLLVLEPGKPNPFSGLM